MAFSFSIGTGITLSPESASFLEVSDFVLYKRDNGAWQELKSYTTSGSYSYLDTYLDSGVSVLYKLTALAPDGSKIAETTLGL